MIGHWLKSNIFRATQTNMTTMHHAVLGTSLDKPLTNDQDEILFACGCFWGAEKGFWKLPGVETTAVGYAGGKIKDPTYNQVCSGNTGHTEVVRVVWNKQIVDLSDLLKLFWECHNPTQGNRQGNDRGNQYRSAIYTNTPNQNSLALESLNSYQNDLSKKGFGTITTEIRSNQIFYFAESYHQQYLAKPNSRPYCSAMPTQVPLGNFKGANFKLDKDVWSNYNWEISHCVLRSNNNPIEL